jgi:prepilin-type N-terminal cleavage/methylation domain-containing protein
VTTLQFAKTTSKTHGSAASATVPPDRSAAASVTLPPSTAQACAEARSRIPTVAAKLHEESDSNHKQRPHKVSVNPKEGQMLRTKKRNEKGFTLIELMIVVVIIGILAALAIPRFMRATTKSKQSEAKQILKQIYTMQRAYRQEYNDYWGNGTTASAAAPTGFSRIGVDIMATARYTYTLVTAANTFTATATSGVLDDDATVDTWTINENGDLLVTSDDVTS